MSRKYNRTTEEFLLELKESGNWNDNYDYSEVSFANTRTNVIVIDKKFNTRHSINPKYLLKGSGCSSKNVEGGYLSFEDCRKYVQNSNLNSEKEWNELRKRGNVPHNIPGDPSKIFKDKWKGMGDWLGNGRIANQNKEYYSFNKSRDLVRKLKIQTVKEWNNIVKNKILDSKIPSNPNRVYKNEWISWIDWLDNGKISSQEKSKLYKPYSFCVDYLRDKKLTSWREYQDYIKINNIIKAIHKNNKVSKRELEEIVGISATAIDNNLNALKDRGLIERVGSAKGGHWKISYILP